MEISLASGRQPASAKADAGFSVPIAHVRDSVEKLCQVERHGAGVPACAVFIWAAGNRSRGGFQRLRLQTGKIVGGALRMSGG
jgi:hypothetical protein